MDKVEKNNDLFVDSCQLPILLAFHDNILESTKDGYGGNLKYLLSPLLNLLCADIKPSNRLTQILSSQNKDLIKVLTQIKDHITKLRNLNDSCLFLDYNDRRDHFNYIRFKEYFIDTLNSSVTNIIQNGNAMLIDINLEPSNLLTTKFENQKKSEATEQSGYSDNATERPTKKRRSDKE